MTTRVGVIGTGLIGQDHIRRITRVLSGAQVVAVTDVDADLAARVAAGVPGARVLDTGQQVVEDDEVDAILVASWGPSHEEYVLACIAADKPVLCEKPLATTRQACLRIVDAEVELGHRVVQVGYMRRYDPAYLALQEVVASGVIGTPLMVHSRHRNPSVPVHYTREMAITDTAVHDFDVVRWLLSDEVAAATVLTPRRSRHGGDLQDPLLILLEMSGGAIVDIETSVNIRYGYDIGGEVVGEDGTAALAEHSPVVLRSAGTFSGRVPADWRERFERAYDVELQRWVDAVAAGQGATGPSSWDGYAAAVVSDAAVQALRTAVTVPVAAGEQPALYRTARS